MASIETNSSAELSIGLLFFLLFLSFGKEFDYVIVIIVIIELKTVGPELKVFLFHKLILNIIILIQVIII